MTLVQGLAFALIAAAIICFVWGRFRYDLVSLVVLTVGVAIGVVPAKTAFDGFSNDVVVIIAAALVVSAAVSRSGVMEAVMRPILPHLKSEQSQVPVLVAATTFLSMVTKNVGALAIMMPVALQLARNTGTSPSRLLMPMSFGSLLGGIVTLVGTSPNILVSQIRENEVGAPFNMFDFTPVGLGLAILGLIFLSVAYRLLPKERQGAVGMETAVEIEPYVTEAQAPQDWARGEMTVQELQALGNGEVKVAAIVRGGDRGSAPLPDARIRPGDKVLLQGGHDVLEKTIARGQLELERTDEPVERDAPSEEIRTAEAIVTSGSLMNGRSARDLDLNRRFGVNLLAVSRQGERITARLRAIRLRAGDVVVLQAGAKALPQAVRDLKLLPLAEREVRLGGVRRGLLPVAILVLAMLLVALKLAPVAVAFFAAAVAIVAVGALSMREAYDTLDGPVLVLIAALVPVSEAVHASGGTDLIAHGLAGLMAAAPPIVALGLLMVASMLAAPFIHNAPTVLVLGPLAVSLAKSLHLNPDPFLMAVATGAACDFLTPVGHQCNTLVMGPGGYKFIDYPRLGAPLSVMVILVGTPVIAAVWPLR